MKLAMAMSDNVLFDPALRTKRFARAKAIGFAGFLHERATDEIKERLNEVNRTFTSAVVISEAPQIWGGLADGAQLQAPSEVLDLPEAAADLVVHGLALHAMNDPVGQFVQARRALRADGLFLGVMFGEATLHELRDALTSAEAEVRGGIAPRVAPMGDLRALGGLLGRAGLALPVADSDRVTVTYASPLHLMHDLRAMGETNPLAAQERGALRRDVLARALEIYAERYRDGAGGIRATFETVYLTGWAPDPSQQKPLRPGSAQMRLADALGTRETSAGETAGQKDET